MTFGELPVALHGGLRRGSGQRVEIVGELRVQVATSGVGHRVGDDLDDLVKRFLQRGKPLGDSAAGVVLGARVPVVLTSRADSPRSRMASAAVAALQADSRRKSTPIAAA